MLKPQERQDLLSTCLHPFLGAGVASWLCCCFVALPYAVAGTHCSELSSSFCPSYGNRSRLKPVSGVSCSSFHWDRSWALSCCRLINASQKKGFLKPTGGVISSCNCFQIKRPWVANEMNASGFS